MKRKIHIAAVLLMSLMLITVFSGTALADSYKFSGKCKYNGEEINSDFTSEEFAASQSELEPGDELSYTVTYTNNSKDKTSWYMRNSVLETLEDAKEQAENGGYTYILKNIGPDGKETVLFDNSEVGGETKTEDLEGLKQATNATGNYFFIQKLKPGESGTTTLYVALDGETEVNDYMDTRGSLMLSYAVENDSTGTNTETPPSRSNPPSNGSPRTGDNMDLLKYVLMMVGALIAALLAIISWRRDRREQAAETAGAGETTMTAGAEPKNDASAAKVVKAEKSGGSGKDGGRDE